MEVKLTRIMKEAEYTMENERYRLIPTSNSPITEYYEVRKNERSSLKQLEHIGQNFSILKKEIICFSSFQTK